MDNNVTVFENKHMMAFIELRDIEKQKKALEDRYNTIREEITRGMDEYGIKSIDNEYVNIVYVLPSPGKPKLDEKTWRAEDPEGYQKVYKLYNKMSGGRKGYVKITTK